MDPSTRFSVVVPLFNCERYLEQCIRALLDQSYPSSHYEVIMVDNNSTDRSAAIVRKYPRIQLLSEAKQGAYAARNLGVSASSGEVIAFTDPDCVPSPDWLSSLDIAMRDSRTCIVLGAQEFGMHSSVLRLLEDYQDEKNDYIFATMIKPVYYGYANNMAVRKSLFDEVGPFVEIQRGADVVFVQRCVDRHSCDAVCYSRTAKVRHLEISSGRKYFQKVYIYAQSIRSYGQIARARPMTNRERFTVFRNTVGKRHYSWTKSLLLLGLLFVGWLYWVSGGLIAAWNSRGTDISKKPTGRC